MVWKTSDPLRISAKERLVLELLLAKGPMYGLELVATSAHRLKRGTVYVTLGRMAQKGLVDSVQDEPSKDNSMIPRRRYRITAHARNLVEARAAALRILTAKGVF
jgi:DNA-binding PadR family transcriptional regulator